MEMDNTPALANNEEALRDIGDLELRDNYATIDDEDCCMHVDTWSSASRRIGEKVEEPDESAPAQVFEVNDTLHSIPEQELGSCCGGGGGQDDGLDSNAKLDDWVVMAVKIESREHDYFSHQQQEYIYQENPQQEGALETTAELSSDHDKEGRAVVLKHTFKTLMIAGAPPPQFVKRPSEDDGNAQATTKLTPAGGRRLPKYLQGLVPGGSLPGAYDVRHRILVGNNIDEDEQRARHDKPPPQEDHDENERYDLEQASIPNSSNEEEPASSGREMDDGYGVEHMVFNAEISRNNRGLDNLLLIDGVKLTDPLHRRALFLIQFGGIALASIIAAVVAAITILSIGLRSSPQPTLSPSSDSHSPRSLPPLANETIFDELSPEEEKMIRQSSRSIVTGGNTSTSIADSLLYGVENGISLLILPSGRLFLDLLNRTDRNFTLFGIMRDQGLLDGFDVSFIAMMIQPLWSGHTLNICEGFVVEGQAIEYEDMFDGMVLTSMAGYPLRIQLGPLRVNNETMSVSERNCHFSNGISHAFLHYPDPVVPWFGKSNFDVLLETSIARHGDLSDFIALIDSFPTLKSQLQEESKSATTLFVPTNEALANMDQSVLVDPVSLQQFLLNHFVSGNFARRCWWLIPTGAKVSDTELRLETQAGQTLNLKIDNATSTVIVQEGLWSDQEASVSTIIQEDIFSHYGILHVINKALLLWE